MKRFESKSATKEPLQIRTLKCVVLKGIVPVRLVFFMKVFFSVESYLYPFKTYKMSLDVIRKKTPKKTNNVQFSCVQLFSQPH